MGEQRRKMEKSLGVGGREMSRKEVFLEKVKPGAFREEENLASSHDFCG